MDRLIRILSLKRPHLGIGEHKLIEEELRPYNPTEFCDPSGVPLAYVVTVTKNDGEEYPVLWSAHIDTVHRMPQELSAYENSVQYDPDLGLMWKDDQRPLGADDGAGVWLLLEMIDANVPGTYVFHRGEECGGIGSSGMAKHHATFLSKHTHAIAFDRRGTRSVITHQGWSRSASDEFAEDFSLLLACTSEKLDMQGDDGGVYTDTAEYVHLIGECSNVSVGYDNEHTGNETLDVAFLISLRNAMIEAFRPAPTLASVRKPGEQDPADFQYTQNWTGYKSWSQTGEDAELTTFSNAAEISNARFQEVVALVRKSAVEDLADLICSLADEAMYGTPDYIPTDTDDDEVELSVSR